MRVAPPGRYAPMPASEPKLELGEPDADGDATQASEPSGQSAVSIWWLKPGPAAGMCFALASILLLASLALAATAAASQPHPASTMSHAQGPSPPVGPLQPPPPPPPWPPAPPPPQPPPPCAWAVGLLNLRELEPPQWCSSLRGDEAGCSRAFVSSDGSYLRCHYVAGGACAARDAEACPSPPSPPPPPPSPPLPPPPPPPMPSPPPWRLPLGSPRTVDAINARFLAGGPANNLASAGVLVRTFDDITDPTKPWLPCPPNFHGCFKYAGLFSVSILWPRHTGIYDTGRGGLVLRGERLRTLCFYAGDGTTMSKVSKEGGPCPEFCHQPGAKPWRCAFAPGRLREGMAAAGGDTHNELVVSSSEWVHELPATVAAFFATPHQKTGQEEVRRLHRAYLREYQLTPREVPLLLLDAKRSPPFSELH